MILYYSPKVQKEFIESAVALRLVTDALVLLVNQPAHVFRVKARTKFEKGVHATGLALDLYFNAQVDDLEYCCARVNARFGQVCTVMPAPTILPSGKAIEQRHVHVQIQFDWLTNPRAFLKAYGFLQSEICGA